MNFPLLVARRYFFSKYKRSFINLIAIISMLGVTVGTAALIFILSVFNGLEGLHRKLFSTIDADLKVTVQKGKNFVADEKMLSKIRQVEGVGVITEIIEDNALVKYGNAQDVVILRGVSDNFLQRPSVRAIIREGRLALHEKGGDYAIVGQGVQHKLSISLLDEFTSLQVWYPKNRRKLNLSSTSSVIRRNIEVGGVFALEQQYDDNYVFVPLDFAKDLLEYGSKRTALEIMVQPGADIESVKARLQQRLGDAYQVQNQEEQHASILRAIKIEKLFVYITLSFIMSVASFNIFFSLTMLAIDKKKDVAVLYAMGATPGVIHRIFLSEGAIVACIGAGIGLLLGTVLCVLQQKFGFISMGISTSVIEAYPVEMKLSDFVLTGIAVIVTTFLASYFPAQKAARQTELRV